MPEIRLFLCGDVMCGRGIDQVLPHSVEPFLHEYSGISARDYVRLAERRNGPIKRPLGAADLWGAARSQWRRRQPHARIANLETALTTCDDWQPKGINYRAHPANVEFLKAAGFDACALANNHVLDWGRDGLRETLSTLHAAGIQTAGAGNDMAQARSAAILPLQGSARLLLFAAGLASSGIPAGWRANRGPGVSFLDDLSATTVRTLARQIDCQRASEHDVVMLSIHWGGNWGYGISEEQRRFAHALVDEAGVDVLHGHSSHHPLAIEVYRGRPILYGCGDFLNDYEGISGHESYRPDLSLMYFLTLNGRHRLRRLTLAPLRIRGFCLHRASRADAQWLCQTLSREGARFNTTLSCDRNRILHLHWSFRAASSH